MFISIQNIENIFGNILSKLPHFKVNTNEANIKRYLKSLYV